MDRPPSRVEWALEGELRGHTPNEVFGYLSWIDAWESEQDERRRAVRDGAVPADAEPFQWLRRWFGR